MRVGRFWGLPAPAILIVFDRERDFLFQCLDKLNSDSTSGILEDVGKEFTVMKRLVDCCNWSVPKFEKVSEQFSPMKTVVNGQLDGTNELFISQLKSELVFRCIEEIIKRSNSGDFKQVDGLVSAVERTVKEESFQLGKLGRVVKGIVKSLPVSSESTIPVLAEKFGLRAVAPSILWFGGEKIRLSEDEQRVWSWFNQRKSFIDEILQHCQKGKRVEEMTFGVPFFDMTKRKPSSLQYKVIDIFDCAKDYKTSHLLVKCREECRQELEKFKSCMQRFVYDGKDRSDGAIDRETFIELLAEQDDDCIEFFSSLVRKGMLRYTDYQADDVRMLCKLYNLIESNSNWDEVLGVSDSASVARHIGFCGLNDYSLELLEEAIAGISLSHRGKIKKSPEYLEEIHAVVSDVDALLQTLLPVGQEI